MLRAMGPNALFAVVPNFSEGRRGEVKDAICAALQVPGARLVARQADADHHRLDTTVVGDGKAVYESAMAAARVAVSSIDMDVHRGAHPRMGAVDVVPFVPVRDATMDDAVTLARAFGRDLAETLDLPVYLYDRAALIPERVSLAVVREGELKGLRADVERGKRLPDHGPHMIGRAGATAVGARKPLVAFNVYLGGDDGDAAAQIARVIRESSGGLPALRAIGFAVPERGGVTVSMNLVDHEVTGLVDAFEAVFTEASARGLDVVDSEVVGLVPGSALGPGVAEHVRLSGFDPAKQVLERAAEGEP